MPIHHPPRELFHDPVVSARMAFLYDRLCALVQPYVERTVRPLVLAERAKPLPKLTLGEIVNLAVYAIVMIFVSSYDPAFQRKGKRVPKKSDPLEDEIDEIATEITCALVRRWMYALRFAGRDNTLEGRVLDLDSLGEAMLPPGADVNIYYGHPSYPINHEIGMEILSQVRLDLPDGRRLPVEMIEILDLQGVLVKE